MEANKYLPVEPIAEVTDYMKNTCNKMYHIMLSAIGKPTTSISVMHYLIEYRFVALLNYTAYGDTAPPCNNGKSCDCHYDHLCKWRVNRNFVLVELVKAIEK